MIEEGFKSRFKYNSAIPFAFYKQIPQQTDHNLISHQHKEIELIAMLDGEAEFYMCNTPFKLKKGDVLVIPPYGIHRARVYSNALYNCICFDLSLLWDSVMAQGLENGALGVSGALPATHECAPYLSKLMERAILAFEKKYSGWELDVIGNLSIIFAQLKRIEYFSANDQLKKDFEFEKKVISYISEHYDEQITSGTVASTLYLNNSYFCRAFKKSFGCSFTNYLLEYRIEKAKFQLYNTNKSISVISRETGFNSFSYFSKIFKHLAGVLPSVYRTECRKE